MLLFVPSMSNRALFGGNKKGDLYDKKAVFVTSKMSL